MIKFEKGNCLKAAWDLAMDKISDKDEHVIVHAMREIYGGEVWGGHAFVLNKTTNRVLSEANNDMQENGGKPLDVSFDGYPLHVRVLLAYVDAQRPQDLQGKP